MIVFNPSLSNNEVDHLNENEANNISDISSEIKAKNNATTKNLANSNGYNDQFKSSSASNLSSINVEMALNHERVVALFVSNQHSIFEQANSEEHQAEDILKLMKKLLNQDMPNKVILRINFLLFNQGLFHPFKTRCRNGFSCL